ncbi:type I restriction-modification system specificity subunit [Staphylococcus nepalensis]|nr:restriction endonuclease subunit S [Staphylococcus nepalensis]SUM66395.1 type I restriction-modification system specificity subunit [Staphylococcus nepalensis]SUM94331.1 type I restriction-modification system specificity subunit [Staphylococcus nepalensis]
MTNEVKNVPELRFPGFEGEWGSSELGNIAENYIGGGTPSTKVKEYWNGNIPWIQSSDLKIDDVKHMEFHKYINSLAIENSSAKLIPKNSIAIVTRVGVGKLALIREEFSTSQDFLSLSNLSLDTNYALYALYKLIRKESTKLQGTSIKGLTKNDLLSKHIKIPSYINEQEQIGDFFSKLDRQIELEEQKLEKLEEQKKGYMQKIFSQELRFKDENGQEYPAWINKKLGDIGKVSMNKRIYKNETSINGEIPFYKIGTFGKEAETFISREKFEEYKNKYPYPEKGDILISASGSIGRTIEYDGEEAYYQDSNIVWLDHNDEVLNIFLKYIYSVIKWSGIEGTTIKRLYNKDILNTKIDLPVIKEQEKIGNFFGKIDDSIEKQSNKIELLKERKRGFLQKMFV